MYTYIYIYIYERLLHTGQSFISSLSRKTSTYNCKCRLPKLSEVVPELGLHRTAQQEVHVSGSDSKFCQEYRGLPIFSSFCLCLTISSAILKSERDQKLTGGKSPCYKGEFMCRKKMRDILRCLSCNDETYCSRCSQ